MVDNSLNSLIILTAAFAAILQYTESHHKTALKRYESRFKELVPYPEDDEDIKKAHENIDSIFEKPSTLFHFIVIFLALLPYYAGLYSFIKYFNVPLFNPWFFIAPSLILCILGALALYKIYNMRNERFGMEEKIKTLSTYVDIRTRALDVINQPSPVQPPIEPI